MRAWLSGWDYIPLPFAGKVGCYVNGHYTDGSCTLGMSRSSGPAISAAVGH